MYELVLKSIRFGRIWSTKYRLISKRWSSFFNPFKKAHEMSSEKGHLFILFNMPFQNLTKPEYFAVKSFDLTRLIFPLLDTLPDSQILRHVLPCHFCTAFDRAFLVKACDSILDSFPSNFVFSSVKFWKTPPQSKVTTAEWLASIPRNFENRFLLVDKGDTNNHLLYI